MWRVERPEPTVWPGEVAGVRLAPGEGDRRAPDRIVRRTEAPPRREHRRKVVRVVVVPRFSVLPDRVGEAPVADERPQRRVAHHRGIRMIEAPQDVPQQDVAREVVRQGDRIVRGGLARRDQAVRGATGKDALEELA